MKSGTINILKGTVAIVLVMAMLLSVCSCSIQGIKESVSQSKEITKQIPYELEQPSDDELYSISQEIIEYQKQLNVFDFAIYCLAHDLSSGGYDVEKGFAILNDSEALVPGLIFKNGGQVEGIDSCGFVQIIDKSSDNGTRITTEMVSQGIVAFSSSNEESVYLINACAEIDGFSGIYNGCYFAYQQVSDYGVEIDARSNAGDPFYENLDCYDYDTGKWLFKGNLKCDDIYADSMYSYEPGAYKKALEVYEKIIQLQNENSKSSVVQTIILFSEDVLKQCLLGQVRGTVNGYSLEELSKIELEKNQILTITSEGVSVQTVADPGERAAMGLIQIITSALAVSASVFIAVATCGAGTPMAITAIACVTGTFVTMYSVSNMVEGMQNFYYGVNGDVSSVAHNPLLEAFKNGINDDILAEKIYHIWGISSGIIQALCIPVASAINLGKLTGMKAKEIAILATRATVTEVVKIATTTVVSIVVGTITESAFRSADAPAHVTKLLSFASALVLGAFTYKALQSIDVKYNISGLNPSKSAIAKRYKAEEYDRQNLKTEDISFADASAKHMENPDRYVPLEMQADAIRYGTQTPDPRGSSAMRYTIEMYKFNVKTGAHEAYTLEVVFDWQTKTVYHFMYFR